MLFQTLMFELVIPNITAKIARACTHLKPMMQARQFSVCGILRILNQNAF